MRPGRLSVPALLVAVSLGAALGGCKYDPHPVDGTLRCSMSGECPEGYTCQTNLCYSQAPSSKIGDYVGEWLLSTTAMVHTECDDGFMDTSLLSTATSPSTMTVTQAGAAALSTFWLCDVTLRWDTTGGHLNDPDPSCMDDGGDPVYTWTATSFELTTPNGLAGMHNATYTRRDEWLDGTIVDCDQTVTAPLIKQP